VATHSVRAPRGTGLLEMLFAAEGATPWCVDVWNCHGVLKPRQFAGYGSIPDLKGVEWLDIGYFTIPVEPGTKLTEKQTEQVEGILFDVLRRQNGAINMSGWYPVFSTDIAHLQLALRGELEVATTEEVVAEVLSALREQPWLALRVWSSAWSLGCWDGCAGNHSENWLFWDGKQFCRTRIGGHHVYAEGMWDVFPEPISDDDAEAAACIYVEHWREQEQIYSAEDFAEYIRAGEECDDLRRVEKCDAHGYYLIMPGEEECPECEAERYK